MATDNTKALLYNKKILPLDVFKAGLLDYLRDEIKRVLEFDYSLPAILSPTVMPVVPSVGNNQLSVAPTGGPWRSTTGTGFLINFNALDARLQNVAIPPDAGTVYSVGLEACEVETGLEQNPRTGEYQYRFIAESIGRKDEPDSVVVAGSNLTITVDAVTEAGRNHTGRQVRVWLKATEDGGPGPQAPLEVNAILVATVAYVGGHNIITVAQLGQTTPSTNPNDYWVQLVGPTVRRKVTEDFTTTVGAVFVAEATSVAAGAPIVTISTASQRLVGFTLADTSEVFRRDTHGHVKVRVKADALDVHEPQLSVNDYSGSQNFAVDETGAVTAASSHITGNEQVDGTLTAAAAHVTGNEAVDGVLSAASAHVTGNSQVDGVATAATAHVTGNEAVDGTLTAGVANVSGLLTAASSRTTGNSEVDGVLTAASEHVTGAAAVDGLVTLGGVVLFTAPSPGNGLSYGANRFSQRQIARAWGKLIPDGHTTGGWPCSCVDSYNIDLAYNDGNAILVKMYTPMLANDYTIVFSFDDSAFGSGTFNGDITSQIDYFASANDTFWFKARDRSGTPAYLNLGGLTNLQISFVVFGQQ